MKKRAVLLIIIIVAVAACLFAGGITAYAEEDGSKELNESISGLLEDLDLSELQQYLDLSLIHI